jgi:hypothetical protein
VQDRLSNSPDQNPAGETNSEPLQRFHNLKTHGTKTLDWLEGMTCHSRSGKLMRHPSIPHAFTFELNAPCMPMPCKLGNRTEARELPFAEGAADSAFCEGWMINGRSDYSALRLA